ncbi:thiolase family protein [Heliophilum fasciatum]|uniref:Acetyl-CoA acetyltransferase n=1 Tax=Heliophilum fasciatum TaxID=35700 RepID=A0A4R2RMW8_9FIRM|nr:thiolase family protein [Heliophilum fasciatum]MCW2278170.1 acetyl-CoA C-acetyltransferase [Heliophilum fasciatum]TCP64009.1 acetyl-CoA C-acetyltransferase [Heliophilum fasciatum]
MTDVYIVGAVRTAVATIGGSLKDISAQDLAAEVFREAVKRSGVPGDQIGEVILGQTRQMTEASNCARVAALIAGLPVTLPAYTIHRQCGSGLQAVNSAWQEIAFGNADLVLAGGVENMSRSPYYLKQARYGYGAGDAVLVDSLTEAGPGAQPIAQYGELSMGATAENLAERYGIRREAQDQFALRSQELAQAAMAAGRFVEEIVPVKVRQKKTVVEFQVDEHPRQTSLEKLAQLPPVFRQGGTVTAGNSSGRNDGAAALLLASEQKVRELGLKPMARLVAQAVAAVDPRIMGIGPVPSTRKALAQAELTLADMDLIELNEAFAAQALAVIEELEPDMDKVNVNGGAIALGHPIGCTGARLLTSLIYELRRRQGRYGLVTLCIGGGQGITTILERC